MSGSMVEVDVRDLVDDGLDWAVAQAEGATWELDVPVSGGGRQSFVCVAERRYLWAAQQLSEDRLQWSPSRDWLQGGRIIDRDGIGFFQNKDAGYCQAALPGAEFVQRGPTPLIAAMRCFVASRLGERVMVPEALLPHRQRTALRRERQAG